MDWSRSRWIQVALGLAIWVGLVVVVTSSWEEVRGELAKAGLLFPLSVLLVGVGLVAGARGWSALHAPEHRRRSMVGFLAAQPAKYLPAGGAIQAAGQVGLSTSPTLSRGGTAWAFLIHAGVQVVAATLVALLFLADVTAPIWLKGLLVVAAVICCAALRRPVVSGLIEFVARLVPRVTASGTVPSTEALWRSVAWTVVPLLTSGAAFALLLGLGDRLTVLVSHTGSFAIAWVVGFLLFPLPSGLGAREAVLLALIPSLPSAQILGVSLIHRFSTILAELIILSAVSRSAFVSNSRRE